MGGEWGLDRVERGVRVAPVLLGAVALLLLSCADQDKGAPSASGGAVSTSRSVSGAPIGTISGKAWANDPISMLRS